MISKFITSLQGRHVTLITTRSDHQVNPSTLVSMFSGILYGIDEQAVLLELSDGTRGVYMLSQIIGFIENEVIDSDDPRLQPKDSPR